MTTGLGITDEAVEAAELALQFDAAGVATYWELARAALSAAVPLLRKAWEQELRQQIADEIEAEARALRERTWAAQADLGPLARITHAEIDGRIIAARLVRSAMPS